MSGSHDVEAVHGKVAARCRFEAMVNLNYRCPPEDLTGAVLTIGSRDMPGKSLSLHDFIRQKVYKGARRYFG